MPPITTPAFAQHAERLTPAVEAALTRYTAYGEGSPASLTSAIRHSLLAPGKRLRPLLVLMAAEACGCQMEAALPAACAVEMVHTYSLIHDDLPAMDDDDLRRGLPTCHKVYGEALAILAGDALLAQAFDVLAHDVQPLLAAGCCAELARAAGPTALVGGQADDLAAEFTQAGPDQLESIHRRKTGALFLASLRMGGIIAQATAAQLAALTAYGEQLGLAFQIVDDLLDHSGSQHMGKRTGKDAARGKLTFPSLWGEAESRRRATELIHGACRALAPFGAPAGGLESLAHYVLERNR